MDERTQAAAAKQKLKRAQGLVREVVSDLAAIAEGADVIGVFDIESGADVETVAAALSAALEQRGRMQVHLVAESARRTPRPR